MALIHRPEHFIKRPFGVCLAGINASPNIYDMSVGVRVPNGLLNGANDSILCHIAVFCCRRTSRQFTGKPKLPGRTKTVRLKIVLSHPTTKFRLYSIAGNRKPHPRTLNESVSSRVAIAECGQGFCRKGS